MWNKRTAKLTAIIIALHLAAPPAALGQYNNQELVDQITGLGVAHNFAFPLSLFPEPITAYTFGSTTYSTNLGLKFMPPALYPPPDVAFAPNVNDGCGYLFTIPGSAIKTRRDYLGLLTDHEDDFDWGELGIPQVYHVNTDVEVGVFAGTTPLDGTVTLRVGTNLLSWRGQTLVTPIMDYPPWYAVLGGVTLAVTRKARIALQSAPLRAQAMFALSELFVNLGLEGISAGVSWGGLEGQPMLFPNDEFIVNRQIQIVRIFDDTEPVFDVTGSTAITVEATQVGGELLSDHIPKLRGAFTVSDACDRIPNVGFAAPPFLPVGEATEITWTASDAGPTRTNFGVNSTTFVQTVTVQDTLPPILVPPPGRVIESSATAALQVGNAAVFDLADVRPTVANDAPASYSPDTRTLVTWSATDASGNSTTANQWITLKAPGTNTDPQAVPQSVAAKTFEPIEIELNASDPDSLSGRFDQLNFSITEPPANGFFVAPLFPYFIEDHRVENALGLTKAELKTELDRLCFEDRQNYVAPVDFVNDPRYITVTDEGVAYVSDNFFVCSSISAQIESKPRIARFLKKANGELEFDRHLQLSNSVRPDSLSIDASGFVYYVVPEAGSSFGHVVGCDPLLSSCSIYDLETSLTSEAEDRLIDDPTSVVVDARSGVMYATDGARSLIAYDLQNVDSNNQPAYLGRVADPDELNSSGPNRKDLAIDSDGNLYLSEFGLDRVYKFGRSEIDRSEVGSVSFTAGEFIGWMGRCDSNLTEARACDEVAERSFGYTCTTEACGLAVANSVFVTGGTAPGQFDQPQGIAIDANDVLYVTDHNNFRVQRFTPEGFFAGEAVSECNGSCFVLGDFGRPEDVSANLQFFYVLDRERDLLHVFETTPITDFDDDTLQSTQTARVTYQSDDGFNGVDTFSFAVSDGLAESSPAEVSVSVTRNFRAPIATESQRFTTDEDTSLDFTISAFDPDVDDQAILVYTIEQQPEHGMIAGPGPEFTYAPDADFFGQDQFTFGVSDGMDSDTAIVSIDVVPVNDAPIITFGRMEDVYGAGFEIKLEAIISDVDLTDRHVYGIQWGAGSGVITGTALPPGVSPAPGAPMFVQSADGTGVLVDYETFFNYGDQTITVCVSDTPGLTSLGSCTDPNVTAIATRTVMTEPRVGKFVTITDNLPTATTELGVEMTEPVVDGQPFNVVFTIHNLEPEDVGTVLDATNIGFSAELASGLVVGAAGVTATTGDAVNPVCSTGTRTLECTADRIRSGGQASFAIEVVGDGSIVADTGVPIVALTVSDEPDHNRMVGNAKGYTLTMNPQGDADGDGVINSLDAFPGDSSESSDFDLDGIGDNADLDDDNDLIPDHWESRYGFDPRNASDAILDGDLDSLTNSDEFERGTRPDTDDSDLDRVGDAIDNCPITANLNQFDLDVDLIGDACDVDTYAAATELADIDNSGNPDYAMIRTDGGRYSVYFKDGLTNLSIGANRVDLGAVTERSIVATVANGDRLAVLSRMASETVLQAIDANNGAIIFDTPVLDDVRRPVTMIAVDNEFWVVAEDSAEVRRISADDGSTVRTVVFDDVLLPVGVAQADATTMALLGVDESTGDVIVELRAIDDGSFIDSISIGGPEVIYAAVSSMNDGFAVMTQSKDGSSALSTWTAGGTAVIAFGAFDADWTLFGVETLPAWSGSGDALAVMAVSSSGGIQMRVIDAANGSEVTRRDFATALSSLRAATVAAVGSASEVGVLIADAANAISLEIQDAEGANANAKVLTAESTQAPPPPPPPPSGGGGGGSVGCPTMLAMMLIWCRRQRSPVVRSNY